MRFCRIFGVFYRTRWLSLPKRKTCRRFRCNTLPLTGDYRCNTLPLTSDYGCNTLPNINYLKKYTMTTKKCKWTLALFALCVSAGAVSAQTTPQNDETAYTIIANPGEKAATQVRINWHTDEQNTDNVCVYTRAGDTNWKRAKVVRAQSALCTAYDSLFSKKPTGESYFERVRFQRCTVELDGLKPGTDYVYRVGRAGVPLDSLSAVHSFRTAPRSGKWAAGVISDYHSYLPLPKRLSSAMTMLDTLEARNGKAFDLMLHVGDVCAWGGSYSFWKRMYQEPFFTGYLWAGVNGNHDNMDGQNRHLSNNYFRYANNNPLNGYAGEEGVCYYFMYGDALFITLNNENMRSAEGLEAAQKWVREVIRNHPARYVIVMEHYQWFFGETGRSSQYGRWKDLFDECGVDLAIGANNHIYVRTNAIYQGEETDGTKGTVYVQLPSSDNERGMEMKDWTENTDLIKYRWSEGGRTVGAILLKADKRKLHLTLYDRQGNPVDEVTVLAKRR